MEKEKSNPLAQRERVAEGRVRGHLVKSLEAETPMTYCLKTLFGLARAGFSFA